MDTIKVGNRVCDLCDQAVTREDHGVTRSFVLTDWGVICLRCWDEEIRHHCDFEVVKVYIVSQTVKDEWITHPLVFSRLDSG
jgi:hypothetical protein